MKCFFLLTAVCAASTLLLWGAASQAGPEENENADTAALAATVPAVQLSVSPVRLDFPEQIPGTASAPRIMTFTNTGQEALKLQPPQITSPGGFIAFNGCPATLSSNMSCTVTVRFLPSPVMAGNITASLSITHNSAGSQSAAGSQTIVQLRGTAALLTVNPLVLRFPTVMAGRQTDDRSISITNHPKGPNVRITSDSSTPGFKVNKTSTCFTATLVAGGACVIKARFEPGSTGIFNERLTVSYTNVPGIPGASNTARSFEIRLLGSSMEDSDGDGIPDLWEDGPQLFAMGADKNVKDIFVELDYLESDPGHSHKPKKEAIDQVVHAFWTQNPRIALHVDCGPECVMDPATGALWGALSKSNSLPHVDPLTSSINHLGIPMNGYNWSSFDEIKRNNLEAGRSGIFRYGIFAHFLAGDATTSGRSRSQQQGSRKTASDFIVSLGGWEDEIGNVQQQAGTFMHELGHNLGLTDGGCTSSSSCGPSTFKPNHLSVMNYFFQMRGLFLNEQEGNVDYAATALTELVETGLKEDKPFGPGVQFGTRYKCPGGAERAAPSAVKVDWDCNGSVSGIVQGNIDGQGGMGTIKGASDWPYLVFAGGAIGQPGAPLPETTQDTDLTTVEDQEISTIYGVSILTSDSLSLRPGTSGTVTFTVLNRGSFTDAYNISFRATPVIASWLKTQNIPRQITMPAGGKYVISIAVGAPAAGFGELILRAQSVKNPNVLDVGRIGISSGRTNLSLSIKDAPDPVFQGSRLTYSAVVYNLGPDDARKVQVTVDLPALDSIKTGGAVCMGTTRLICTLRNLDPGQAAFFTISGTPIRTGVLRAVFRVTASTSDPFGENNVSVVTTVSQPPLLPAPVQISPPNKAVFDIFPRTTVLRWQPVNGAAAYGVEIDCFHCCASNRWCSEVGGATQVVQRPEPGYTFNFVGAQPGRWRVWAIDTAGRRGNISGWWEFRYLK